MAPRLPLKNRIYYTAEIHKMTERKLLSQFTPIVKGLPGAYWCKIGDTFGGHKKPCDVFAGYDSKFFMIEFKKENNPLTDYQIEQLISGFHSGSYTFLAEFFNLRGTERNIKFIPFIDGVEKENFQYLQFYKNGKYDHIEDLFFFLIYFFNNAKKEN